MNVLRIPTLVRLLPKALPPKAKRPPDRLRATACCAPSALREQYCVGKRLGMLIYNQ
ncbi:hypothetical protein C4K04_0907 [Pseudomonas chlororaphis]|uniref:Uncharacterized protein n=1 Tax=Pseudomonas chlororaphis TaxID=587753 RepID=A0A3G7TJS8_9PSED|nr:hypothetical protein C4K04_0907 [Pseudomonas chlororaphis]